MEERMDLKIYERNEEIKAHQYLDAVILPRVFQGEEPMWGLGGVCDKDGVFVEASAYDGGWARHGGKYDWNREEEEFFDGYVIYFGVFYKHWGHFLVDLVGRMWYPACSGEYNNRMKVAYLGEEEPESNHLDFFRLLGIHQEQLLHVKRPIRCKKVIVPEVAARSCLWYTKEFARMFDVIAGNASDDLKIKEKYEDVDKVYFTRTKFAKARGSEFGEGLIEDIFTANGYKSIAPEQLSLPEQIYLWNHAEKIACINGTIPLNAAFSRNPKLDLLVMNKTSHFHGNPYLFIKMRGIKAVFIDVYREPFKKYPKSLGEGPFLIEVSRELRQWLERSNCKLSVTEKQILFEKRKNYFKYCLCIIGIRRKMRTVVGNIVPKSWKKGIRKIIGG